MRQTPQGLQYSIKRYHMIPRTLSFISHDDQLLLLKGSPQKRLWANKYNAIGGHVEQGETIRDAALREIREETGLELIEDFLLRGIITVDTEDPTIGIAIFVFTGISPSKQLRPSAEGELKWVRQKNIPELPLVEDLPTLLAHLKHTTVVTPPFYARYWYNEAGELQTLFLDG